MSTLGRKRAIVLPHGIQLQEESRGWRVRLGSKFTGGEVVRKRFSTKDAACAWIDAQTKDHNQIRTLQMTPSQMAEARRAIDILGTRGRLDDAARYFVLHHRSPAETRPIGEAVKGFLAAKLRKGLKPRSLQAYKETLNNFAEDYVGSTVAEITREEVEDWLDEETWALPTILHQQINLSVFFKWCTVQNWIAKSPVDGIEKPILDDTPPGILTVSQLARLLRKAATMPEYQPLVPVIAIGAFAGARTSEIRQLDWKEVSFTQESIEITAAKSKTRQRRNLTMSANLVSWLTPFRHLKGGVWPVNYFKLLAELREKLQIQWPKNALRHSFASYHLAFHNNAGGTATQLGHRDTQMLFKIYRDLVKRGAADLYWAIHSPEKSEAH